MSNFEYPAESLESIDYVLWGGGGGTKAVAPGFIDHVGEGRVAIVTGTGDGGSKTGVGRHIVEANGVPLPGIGDIRAIAASVSSNGAGALFETRYDANATTGDINQHNGELLQYAKDPETADRIEQALNEHVPGIVASIFEYEDRAGADAYTPSTGLRGYTLGNIAIAALFKHHEGDLGAAVADVNTWLATRALVMSVTNTPYTLNMDYEGIHEGEEVIDELEITRPQDATLWLETVIPGDEFHIDPSVRYVAERAIRNVVLPGSLFTTFGGWAMVPGVDETLQTNFDNGGTFDAVANIEQGRDAIGLTVRTYTEILGDMAGRMVDNVVVNTLTDVLPEGRIPLKYDESTGAGFFTKVIPAEILEVAEHHKAAERNDPIAHLRSKVKTDGRRVGMALVGAAA